MSARLAAVARSARDDLIGSGKSPPDYATFVDGREGASEDTARKQIVYQFNIIGAAAAFTLSFLRARSPLATGEYRDSFYLGINGRFVPQASFVAGSVPFDAEVTIGNTQPQSRKIDVQLDGSRTLHYSVPPGLFDNAVSAIKTQFGGTVTAKRVYSLSFPGQYVLRHGGGAVQSPALVMRGVF